MGWQYFYGIAASDDYPCDIDPPEPVFDPVGKARMRERIAREAERVAAESARVTARDAALIRAIGR